MFAIVEINGKQYNVEKGSVIEVENIEGKQGDVVVFAKTLLVDEGKKIAVGTPNVKGVSVSAKIIFQGKGEKIDVRRFKSKVRERRAKGFRPHITKLEILSIGHA